MTQVWILTDESDDDEPEILGVYEDRADGFKVYAERVKTRFSTTYADISANDYAPGGNVEYSDGRGGLVELTGHQLIRKGK